MRYLILLIFAVLFPTKVLPSYAGNIDCIAKEIVALESSGDGAHCISLQSEVSQKNIDSNESETSVKTQDKISDNSFQRRGAKSNSIKRIKKNTAKYQQSSPSSLCPAWDFLSSKTCESKLKTNIKNKARQFNLAVDYYVFALRKILI